MFRFAIIVDFQGTLQMGAVQSLSVGTVESLVMLQANALMIQYATLVVKLATSLEIAQLHPYHLEI